ncbi:MAG: hypothetical protein LBU55_02730 [Elusimicrobiota bacterium]|jgi:LPS-assembly protein|nr:hypothetical protein [Elusimicrobiota bacterium]
MKFFFLKVFFPSVFIFCFSVVSAHEIDINAQYLEYDENCGSIFARDSVILQWENKKIYADYVEFVLQNKTMKAFGNVKIEEDGNIIFADRIFYNYDEKHGDIDEAAVCSSLAFIRSQQLRGESKNVYKMKNTGISNCDLDEPHVCFKAKSGRLAIDERITIYNPVLFIGKIPVFYLPFFTKSLKGGKSFGNLDIEFEPGYTNEGGLSLKTTLKYPITKELGVNAVYDYLGTRGNGYGTELNYHSNGISGNLYAYTIRDKIAQMQRWSIRPYFWQRIGKWTVRSQGEFMSDSKFNNYYNDSWERVANILNSYASISRQDSSGNLTISAQRYDAYDANKQKYTLDSQTLPTITYSSYSKKLLAGITGSFNFNYNRMYQQSAGGDYKNSGNFSYSLMKDFKIAKRLTLKPSLAFNETWSDRDEVNLGDIFNAYYTGSLNSRFRATSWVDWNVNYSISARSKKNSLYLDNLANDYGISQNAVSFSNSMYIGERTSMRNSFSYSFLQNRTDEISQEKKWSPVVTEIIWTPKYYITAYIRQSQSVVPVKFNAFQVDVQIGELEKFYFNFGSFYQNYDTDLTISARSKEIDNNFGIGLWLTPKWRFDYDIRTTMSFDKTYIRMSEQEFKLYRDLHCYNLGIKWTIKNGYSSFFLKFDLKTNMPFDRTKKNFDSSEAIFYPWR